MAAAPFRMIPLIVAMAAFLILGGALAFVLWHNFSTLLYGNIGRVDWVWLTVAIPLFVALLFVLRRFVHRVTREEGGST